jgi:hypothetical protein
LKSKTLILLTLIIFIGCSGKEPSLKSQGIISKINDINTKKKINKIVENKKYFKQEIKNLTAGIIKPKILDEKYDEKM